MKIKLGVKAKDKITGFEGIVVSKIEYLTGCDQYDLLPKVKNGEFKDSKWFDVSRLEVTGKGIKIETVQYEDDPGGPTPNVPKMNYP